MRGLALLVLLLPAHALAFGVGSGFVSTKGGGSVAPEAPRCDFAYQLPGVKGGEFFCDPFATPITTTRASTATCINGGTVAANVACVSAGGLECFAAGAGGRTAADVHRVSTAGWPVGSGEIRLRYTPSTASISGATFLDTRPAGQVLGPGFKFYWSSTGRLAVYAADGSSATNAQTSAGALTWAAGQAYDLSFRWQEGSLLVFRNGVQVASATGAVPLPPSHAPLATLGSAYDGAEQANGSIKVLRVGN